MSRVQELLDQDTRVEEQCVMAYLVHKGRRVKEGFGSTIRSALDDLERGIQRVSKDTLGLLPELK